MDVNLTRFTFIFFAGSVGFVSLLIHSIDNYLPILIKKTFRYGKYAEKKDHFIVNKCEVPKRWFGHFYIFAAPLSTLTLIILIKRYIYNGEMSSIVCWLLDFQLGTSRKALVSPESTFLALILLTIQCWKRFYETHYVSVFSDAKINISHYMVGFIHYIGTVTSIIGESQGFTKNSSVNFRWDMVNRIDYLWMIIFLLASYAQLRSNIILANLRKNKEKIIDTKSYKIPRGELFEYTSSPLQFTESIMYLMLTMILWSSSTYHYIFFWVLINQTETAVSTHKWYKNTFKNYPKNRKIYIPFII